MSKYQSFNKQKDSARNEIHPIWRGIGCLIMLILPVISGAAAVILVDFSKAQNWGFVYELSEVVHFPSWAYQIPYISIAANYISSIAYLKAMMLFFVLVLVLLSGVFAVLNAVLYRIIGPPRYSSTDVPAPRVKTKRYTR